MSKLAYDLAVHTANELVKNRTVMVLFPSRRLAAESGYSALSQIDGLWVRFADEPSGLKSLAIDTLIVLAPRKCDRHGVKLAIERTRTSLEPKLILLEDEA